MKKINFLSSQKGEKSFFSIGGGGLFSLKNSFPSFIVPNNENFPFNQTLPKSILSKVLIMTEFVYLIKPVCNLNVEK